MYVSIVIGSYGLEHCTGLRRSHYQSVPFALQDGSDVIWKIALDQDVVWEQLVMESREGDRFVQGYLKSKHTQYYLVTIGCDIKKNKCR